MRMRRSSRGERGEGTLSQDNLQAVRAVQIEAYAFGHDESLIRSSFVEREEERREREEEEKREKSRPCSQLVFIGKSTQITYIFAVTPSDSFSSL